MRSEKLRHFPETDPPSATYRPEKQREREEIQELIKKFLSNGGQIHEIDHTANRNPQFIIGNVIRPEK
jgi:hypothetical protein